MIHGLWEVTGTRAYRGHAPGVRFEASLQDGPAGRAVSRGDIRLVEQFLPALPAEYQLPKGWVQ